MSNEVLSILTITVPIITALVSGIFSYVLAVKKSNKDIEKISAQHKQDLEKLEKQHNQDLETLGERHKQDLETITQTHKLEMEKIQLQQAHERQMKEQENIGKMSMGILGPLLTSVVESDAYQKLLSDSFGEAPK